MRLQRLFLGERQHCPRKRARGEVTSRQARAVGRVAAGGNIFRAKRDKPDLCGGDSGEERGREGGQRGGSRVAFGKRVGGFVRHDGRASRRLCRTCGLPASGKSSAIRLLCHRRGNRVRVHPDPSGGRVRRRVVGGSLPVARLENRSRLARPLSASVVGRCRKPRNFKLAEREGFEPSIRDLVPYDGLANRCLQPLGHLSVEIEGLLNERREHIGPASRAQGCFNPDIARTSCNNQIKPLVRMTGGALPVLESDVLKRGGRQEPIVVAEHREADVAAGGQGSREMHLGLGPVLAVD